MPHLPGVIPVFLCVCVSYWEVSFVAAPDGPGRPAQQPEVGGAGGSDATEGVQEVPRPTAPQAHVFPPFPFPPPPMFVPANPISKWLSRTSFGDRLWENQTFLQVLLKGEKVKKDFFFLMIYINILL